MSEELEKIKVEVEKYVEPTVFETEQVSIKEEMENIKECDYNLTQIDKNHLSGKQAWESKKEFHMERLAEIQKKASKNI